MECASHPPFPFLPGSQAWLTGGQDVHRTAREHRNQRSGGALQQRQETAEEEANLLTPRGLRQDLEVSLLQGGHPRVTFIFVYKWFYNTL